MLLGKEERKRKLVLYVREMEGDECKAYALLNSLFAMIVK
jgi:hypothetical protein